jgi:F0F1-type ATP synthase assembly protein I
MKYSKNVFRALTMITQFGINMIVPIFICSFLGMWLDRKLGTSFFMVLFFFIGAIAGGRNVWIFARKIYTNKEPTRKRANSLEASDDTKTEKNQ